MKKNKLNGLLLANLGTLAIGGLGISYAAFDSSKNTVLESNLQIDKNANFGVSTNALKHNTVYPIAGQSNVNHRKDLNSSQDVSDIYYGKSVLSTHTINTVLSADYFFNFISDQKREEKINIVASPINVNIDEIIIVETDFTSIDDSAIFINDNLVLVATQNDSKILVNYKFETIFNESEKRFQKTLTQKDQTNVTNIFGNLNIEDKKFALSPVQKTFESIDVSNIMLWPMNATVLDFHTNRTKIIHEITIDENGKIKQETINSSFSLPSSPNHEDTFASLTPLRIINEDGSNGETKFFGITRGTNVNAPIRTYEFQIGAEKTPENYIAYTQNTDTETYKIYQAPTLEKIAPYAMVRMGEDNKFYLFWISQNDADRNDATNLAVPEAMIRTEVSWAKQSSGKLEFNDINSDSIQNVPYAPVAGIAGVMKIDQIQYGLGSSQGVSHMGLRLKNRDAMSSTVYNNYSTTIMPTIINDFTFENLHSVFRSKMFYSSNGTNVAQNGMDTQMMKIVNEGLMMNVGIDNYDSSRNLIDNPNVSWIQWNLTTDLISWSSELPNNYIYLPETNEDFYGLSNPSDLESKYLLPAKIADINFDKNQTNTGITPWLENSILWYSRYYIDNITKNLYYGNNGANNMVLTGDFTFKDAENKIISNKLDDDGTAPNDAVSAEIFVTIPRTLINGIIFQNQSQTFKMTFIDNPGKPSEKNKVVSINNGFISGTPTNAANILNALGSSKIIPDNQNVVGIKMNMDDENLNSLFNIDQDYFNLTLQNVSASADDFNGKLDVEFSFTDQNGYVYSEHLSVSGFENQVVIIPMVVGPIAAIALIVLIIIIILSRRNKVNVKKSTKAGYVLAKKMNKKLDYSADNVLQKEAIETTPIANQPKSPGSNVVRKMDVKPNSTQTMGGGVNPTQRMNQGVRPPGSNVIRKMDAKPNPNQGTNPSQRINQGGNPTKPIATGTNNSIKPNPEVVKSKSTQPINNDEHLDQGNGSKK